MARQAFERGRALPRRGSGGARDAATAVAILLDALLAAGEPRRTIGLFSLLFQEPSRNVLGAFSYRRAIELFSLLAAEGDGAMRHDETR